MHPDSIHIDYGRGAVPVRIDPARARWHIVQPRHVPPLDHPREHFRTACANPLASPPLAEIIAPTDRIVITTSDGTRPVPNRALLPWLLEILPVAAEHITLVVGAGTHRPNTAEELEHMLGPAVLRRIRVVNHDAYDPGMNVRVGETAAGLPVLLNRHYVEADKRIALGFIEPHFFAGFSGGPKAVAPGLASIDTILGLHSYGLVADPQSTWGVLDGNPLQQALRDAAACCPPDFLINVTLNTAKELTGIFCGQYLEAHRAGCLRATEDAMAPVTAPCPLVITSNSGFPLDQNLYQSVKGMSDAALIIEDGGTLFISSECSDGVPSHGNFGRVLSENPGAKAIDAWLRSLETPVLDQWQIQLLMGILQRCTVRLYSELEPNVVASCSLLPCGDFQRAIYDHVRGLGRNTPVAVLPQGPLTIPYLA